MFYEIYDQESNVLELWQKFNKVGMTRWVGGGGGGGGGGVEGTRCISMCMEVLTKGGYVQRLSGTGRLMGGGSGVGVHCKKIWKRIQINMLGKQFMSVWKGGSNLP